MQVKKLKRSFFQRLLGRPATSLPENNDFWAFSGGKITLDLSQAPKIRVVTDKRSMRACIITAEITLLSSF